MFRSVIAPVMCAAVLLATASIAPAQCDPHWLPGLSLGGVDGVVRAVIAWDPDGPGPLPEWTVFGGDFSSAGDVRASNIAAWDGQSWHDLGGGVDDFFPGPNFSPGTVYALAVYHGDLIAAGRLRVAGGAPVLGLARYKASTQQWHHMGFESTGAINALAVHDGDVVVGGSFPDVGASLARYDGLQWTFTPASAEVRALAVHGGDLYAAGSFVSIDDVGAARIARWDGQAWSPLGAGLSGAARLLVSLGDDLVAAGSFSSAGGAPASRVARWDGAQWSAFPSYIAGLGSVTAAAAFEGDLFVAGSVAGGLDYRVARYDATTDQWHAIVGDGDTLDSIDVLAAIGGRLIAGGGVFVIDDIGVAGIGLWDGSAWSPVCGGVHFTDSAFQNTAFAEHDGELYVGGRYWIVGGGTPGPNVGRWRGGSLVEPLPRLGAGVEALLSFGGDLIAGGVFSAAAEGGTAVNIARWDGQQWWAMGQGLSPSPGVIDLVEYRGDLIAAGGFTVSGAASISRIARWNGETWEPFAGGASGIVNALAVDGDDLYAAGEFLSIGGVPAARVARYDGATGQWHALGAGLGDAVRDLVIHDGALVAAGNFPGVVARFDAASQQWTVLAPGPGSEARALAVHDGDLYVASLRSLGRRISRWTGSEWAAVAVDMDSIPLDLYSYGSELLAAGPFGTVSGLVSEGVARYTTTGVPTIAVHPRPAAATPGGSATLSVTIATGYDGLSFQWRRAGLDLADGPTPHGAIISGATTPTLTIAAITPDDAGLYDCLVTNPCGETTSRPAAVAVVSVCPADWDASGVVNSNDISAFLAQWLDSIQNGTLVADFNNDLAVNSSDISAFLTAWLDALQGGC